MKSDLIFKARVCVGGWVGGVGSVGGGGVGSEIFFLYIGPNSSTLYVLGYATFLVKGHLNFHRSPF